MRNDTIPGILGQELFVQYAARWLEAVESADPAVLQRSFETAGPDGQPRRLRACHFRLRHIIQLVSVVGAAHIKASFVLVPTPAPDGLPRFTLVLSASNALGARVSSYYLAEPYELPAEEAELALGPDEAATLALGALPAVLGREWARHWRQAPRIEPALFASAYGYLRGYSFELSDFVAVLAGVQNPEAGGLVLHFGLHEYYRPDPVAGDSLGRLFGLLLQLRGADKGRPGGDGDDPGYNMGHPCPPDC
ncbi:hypothetical protein HHL22_08600 [Hymenobacter sp. RP-2-7]|uniref:Uncharacterized protein n=1 Tax=Hymenobacter polaris TaxID=2682546 RepID=A0A7Y0ADA6_9BACT|nr:hypothetical protein [Hymenobacter polaris]NML65261.1 hypothetical protein [Hymenobacter polaris]